MVLRANLQKDKLHYKALSLRPRKKPINRQLVIFTMFQFRLFTIIQFRIEYIWPTPDKEAVAKAEPKWNRQKDLLMKRENYNPAKVRTRKYTSSWCWWEWGVRVSAGQISLHYVSLTHKYTFYIEEAELSQKDHQKPLRFHWNSEVLQPWSLGYLGILEF